MVTWGKIAKYGNSSNSRSPMVSSSLKIVPTKFLGLYDDGFPLRIHILGFGLFSQMCWLLLWHHTRSRPRLDMFADAFTSMLWCRSECRDRPWMPEWKASPNLGDRRCYWSTCVLLSTFYFFIFRLSYQVTRMLCGSHIRGIWGFIYFHRSRKGIRGIVINPFPRHMYSSEEFRGTSTTQTL